MKIQYCCTYWGSEHDDADRFVNKVVEAGYDGIEINLPPPHTGFTAALLARLDEVRKHRPDFILIVQQLTAPQGDTVAGYISRMQQQLRELAAWQPHFINSQTGADYYSFDDNCRVLEAALEISQQTGVRILHETHRSKFSFHAATLLPYLRAFPELELAGDFSHFCTVSESMLQEQADILQQIMPRVSHIHARVGHEQAAQVADPFAPEWQQHLLQFEAWWQQIIRQKQQAGWQQFTITPEFGPAPYMPAVPFTRQPLGHQWHINHQMMLRLRQQWQ